MFLLLLCTKDCTEYSVLRTYNTYNDTPRDQWSSRAIWHAVLECFLVKETSPSNQCINHMHQENRQINMKWARRAKIPKTLRSPPLNQHIHSAGPIEAHPVGVRNPAGNSPKPVMSIEVARKTEKQREGRMTTISFAYTRGHLIEWIITKQWWCFYLHKRGQRRREETRIALWGRNESEKGKREKREKIEKKKKKKKKKKKSSGDIRLGFFCKFTVRVRQVIDRKSYRCNLARHHGHMELTVRSAYYY